MISEPTRLVREEIHHRFLNTLTALHGLLRRDFAAFEDPDVKDAVTTFEGQLMAFAGVHRSLNSCSASGNIDVPTHFARLCAQLCHAHLAPRGHGCEFWADEGEIRPEAGEKLGLIIAELMTNCAKHAFLDHRRGRVSVSLTRWDDGWMCVVQDDGLGIRHGRVGEGLRLVNDLARAIHADVAFQSNDEGVRVTLRLPQANLAVAANQDQTRARPDRSERN